MARTVTHPRRPRPRAARARRPVPTQAVSRRSVRSARRPKKKLGRRKRFSTAVDIGHYSVKIVTVAVDEARQVEVQRATVQPLDRSGASGHVGDLRQAQVAALKAALSRHGRPKGRIVVALPRALTTVRYLTLPSSDYEELKEMILLDAERHIPFSIDEVEIGFEILQRPGEHESYIMMVSAPRAEIYSVVDLCREAGLIVEAVDVDILGACRAYLQDSNEGDTTAVVDFGRENTTLGIVSQGRVLFTRSLSVGESKLLAEFPGSRTWADLRTRLAAIGALPPEIRSKVENWLGDLYTDLMRSVSAFACEHPGSRVDRIVLCGGGPYLPSGPSDALMVRLRTKAVVEQPLDGDLPADSSYRGPELAAAVGIALRSLDRKGEAINLLPNDMVAERERQEQKAFMKSACFLALLAFVCAGVGLYLRWEKKYSQLVELRNQIEAIKPETEKLRRMDSLIRIVDSYLDREHSCLTVLAAVLESLPNKPPKNVSISRLQYGRRNNLRIEGQVRTNNDVNMVNDVLLKLGPQVLPGKPKIFREVHPIGHSRRELGFDNQVAWDFTFDCELEYKEMESERERVRARRGAGRALGR